MHWRRKWQPTPVFLPGESQGWGSLLGCCLWGCTESDMTEGPRSSSSHEMYGSKSIPQSINNFYNDSGMCVLSELEVTRIQLSSVAQSFLTLCDSMDYSMPDLPVHHQLPDLFKLMSIESVMPSNQLILCRPLLLLPSIFPTIRVFSNESILCIRCPKFCSFSFSISPFNEYSGLISFRMDWFDLLAVKGTLDSLSNTTVQNQFFCAQFLYSPTLTSIHNYWKNNRSD